MTCEGERVLGKRFDPPFLNVQVCIGCFNDILNRCLRFRLEPGSVPNVLAISLIL
jgi:hypothetical protein